MLFYTVCSLNHFTVLHPEIQCPPLTPLGMGNIAYTNAADPDYPIDTYAIYVCGPEYTLVGDVFRVCSEDGTWSGTEAVCEGEYVCATCIELKIMLTMSTLCNCPFYVLLQ